MRKESWRKEKWQEAFLKGKTQAKHDIKEEESSDDVLEAPANAPAKKAQIDHSFQEKWKAIWAWLVKTDNGMKCQIYILQVHQKRQCFHKWM